MVRTLQSQQRLDLAAPIVDEAVGGSIPGDVSTATVRIKVYAGMKAGDRITLHLVGSAPTGSVMVVREVGPGDAGKDLVYSASLLSHRNTDLYIIYEVENTQGRSVSFPLSVLVEGPYGRVSAPFAYGGGPQLPAEFLPLTSEDGCIPVRVSRGAARPGDRFTLYMLAGYGDGQSAIMHQYVDGSTGEALRFCLPYDELMSNGWLWINLGCVLTSLSSDGSTVSTGIRSYRVNPDAAKHGNECANRWTKS